MTLNLEICPNHSLETGRVTSPSFSFDLPSLVENLKTSLEEHCPLTRILFLVPCLLCCEAIQFLNQMH